MWVQNSLGSLGITLRVFVLKRCCALPDASRKSSNFCALFLSQYQKVIIWTETIPCNSFIIAVWQSLAASD